MDVAASVSRERVNPTRYLSVDTFYIECISMQRRPHVNILQPWCVSGTASLCDNGVLPEILLMLIQLLRVYSFE
jgi:hypothetical protein